MINQSPFNNLKIKIMSSIFSELFFEVTDVSILLDREIHQFHSRVNYFVGESLRFIRRRKSRRRRDGAC